MASLKDVAQATGYSIRTVSRVLRDSGYASEAAKREIKAAAEQMGYVPNLAARALRTNTSYEVVVVPASLDELHMTKIAGITDILTPAGYSMVMISPSDHENTQKLADAIINKSPAGVIFASIHKNITELSDRLKTVSIPSIFIDSNNRNTDVNSVFIDRPQGIYEAVEHLCRSGRRRIAYLGGKDFNRIDGYSKAIRDNGLYEMIFLTAPSDMNDFSSTINVIEQVLPELLAARPDAVQCYSDVFAMAFLGMLHERSIKVPGDIAVVGFDDRNFAKMAWPALTTVAQPSKKLGQTAADMLIKLIAAPSSESLKITLPTELMVRQSA